MVVNWINKLFSVFYGIVTVFNKLLCFLHIKRGRRNSGSILPLHSDGLGKSNLNDTIVQQSLPSNDHADMELESWESWGAEDQIRNGSHNNIGNQIPNNYHPNTQDTGRFNGQGTEADFDNEPEIDYFQDMIPQVKKQPKIIVRKKEDYSQRSEGFSKRLTLNTEVPFSDDPNLGAWDDSENAWGDELSEDLSWEAKSAIKERRREEREQRQAEQLHKKQEREKQRLQKGGHLSAVKLS